MSIAILCPTRGRPEEFKRMRESVEKTATSSIGIYAVSNGQDSYVPNVSVDMPTVHMWNSLCKNAMTNPKNQLFMLGADDTVFSTPGWDDAILDHYNNLEDKIHVYSFQDSRDRDGTPHPIVTREYIDAMGYFLPPIYLHWFVDLWTVAIAKANNCFTHLHDYQLIHIKPSDSGNPDETHSRIRRMGWHDRDKYVNDTCQHFLSFEKNRLGSAIMAKKHQKFLQSMPCEFT